MTTQQLLHDSVNQQAGLAAGKLYSTNIEAIKTQLQLEARLQSLREERE